MASLAAVRETAGKVVTGLLIASSFTLLAGAAYGAFSFSILRKIDRREKTAAKQVPVAVGADVAAAPAASAEAGEDRR